MAEENEEAEVAAPLSEQTKREMAAGKAALDRLKIAEPKAEEPPPVKIVGEPTPEPKAEEPEVKDALDILDPQDVTTKPTPFGGKSGKK